VCIQKRILCLILTKPAQDYRPTYQNFISNIACHAGSIRNEYCKLIFDSVVFIAFSHLGNDIFVCGHKKVYEWNKKIYKNAHI